MSLIDELADPSCWERFYLYKSSLCCAQRFTKALRAFIDGECYADVYRAVRDGKPFPLPRKSVISKMSSARKRTVYTYPHDENVVLKLMTHLILRRYDNLFCPNLYSFRPGRTVKDALRYLTGLEGVDRMYSYKVDISNYFNSIPVNALIPELEQVMSDDPVLFGFLRDLLEEERVIDGDTVITENKGIMAGTPQASFFANLYLRGLDRYFYERGIPYARYSDDILILGKTEEEVRRHASYVREYLASRGLTVNPDKESYSTPGEGWVFLGFCYRAGVIDIAPASVLKIKAKMRRKMRSLMRWTARKGELPARGASAFIRIFNSKLFEHRADEMSDNELTWSKWYFPVINTDRSLKAIDHYAQECVRYLVSGTRGKARFRVSYEDMKALGLRSLVGEYYGS